MMELVSTQCCAVMEVAHLHEHADAEEAMVGLCEEIDESTSNYDVGHYREGAPKGITLRVPGHVIFTAVVGYTTNRDEQRQGVRPAYGPKFMAYIRRNKLGKVIQGPVQVNRINHPTHKVRVYVWTPNVKNLQKWWNARKPEESKTRNAYGWEDDDAVNFW